MVYVHWPLKKVPGRPFRRRSSTLPRSSPRPFVFRCRARRRDLRLTASTGAQSAPVGVGPWPIPSRYRSSCQCLLGTDMGIPSSAPQGSGGGRRPEATAAGRNEDNAERLQRRALLALFKRRPSHKSAGPGRCQCGSLPHPDLGPGSLGQWRAEAGRLAVGFAAPPPNLNSFNPSHQPSSGPRGSVPAKRRKQSRQPAQRLARLLNPASPRTSAPGICPSGKLWVRDSVTAWNG